MSLNLLVVCLSEAHGMVAGPVLKCNDTEDDRAKVLDCEELMQYLHQRAQAAVNSRDDADDHQRHVSFDILANSVKPHCTNPSHACLPSSTFMSATPRVSLCRKQEMKPEVG